MATLASVAEDPSRAAGLRPAQARALLAECATLQGALLAAALAPEPLADLPDVLLPVEEAAKIIGASKDWCYRNKAKLPHVRQGGSLRFPKRALERYIQSRTQGV